jgi:hypothetical protein
MPADRVAWARRSKIGRASMIGPKPAGAAMALLLAAATAGCAGEMREPAEMRLSHYDTWDTNRDSLLDTEEFAAGPYHSWYSSAYDVWDHDGDGFVTDEEFRASPQWHADTGVDAPRQWDTDQSGTIEEDEFQAGAFEHWDADRDGLLDQDEFYAGAYDSWDTDRDGLLSDEEFGAGTAAWRGDSDLGDFGAWDADGDGSVDSSEFYDGLAG